MSRKRKLYLDSFLLKSKNNNQVVLVLESGKQWYFISRMICYTSLIGTPLLSTTIQKWYINDGTLFIFINKPHTDE